MRRRDEEARRQRNAETRRRGEKKILAVKLFLFSIGAVLMAACQPNAAIMNSAQRDVPVPLPAANSAEKTLSPLERDVETMRTANFDYIYVYRRKDGGVFDSEDKLFIKNNSPYETNRRILTDGDKAVIAGSNTKFKPEQIKILEQRFNVEDFSKPASELPADAAANAGNSGNAVNAAANNVNKMSVNR